MAQISINFKDLALYGLILNISKEWEMGLAKTCRILLRQAVKAHYHLEGEDDKEKE
jgi:hypothetical protein